MSRNENKTTAGTQLGQAACKKHKQKIICYATGQAIANDLPSLQRQISKGVAKKGKLGSYKLIDSKPVGRWADLSPGERTQARNVFRKHNSALLKAWNGDGSTGATVQADDKADRVDVDTDALEVSELEGLKEQRDQLAAVHATGSTDLSAGIADLDAKIAALTPDPVSLDGLDRERIADLLEQLAAVFRM